MRASPHARTLSITPPHDFAQTCNIAYPVALLERVDEGLPAPAGEDTDLAFRARVYHAVEAYLLPAAIRLNSSGAISRS